MNVISKLCARILGCLRGRAPFAKYRVAPRNGDRTVAARLQRRILRRGAAPWS